MPAALKNAPTVATFAETWVREVFEPALGAASGKDRKLSAREAARGAAATEGRMFLAGSTLETIRALTGVKTPGFTKLKDAALSYATSQASSVAGSDGKVSVTDARKMDPALERGYLTLRGRNVSPSPPSAVGLGVISDIDKTVMPPEVGGSMVPAYPGVATLFRELDLAADDELDATYYVTARSPDRLEGVAEWLAENSLHSEGISTGIGTQPWVAEPEKVKDILAIMDENPGQKYVLFGDTSHRDPEVYRKVLAQRPDQVAAVVIHKVNNTVNASRVEGMLLVDNYAEAAASLYHAGLMSKHAARKVITAARAGGLELTAAQGEALLNS